jgi:16S rRNA (cytidine1402-2'-O)-methyltransferase
MALYVVATPIGNLEDVSRRALKILSECELVIGEESKEASKLLKFLGLPAKPIEELNEHSRAKDLAELVEFCRHKTVALVSDCGTPGFCDPGADLVQLCRAEGVSVRSVPGVSSLAAFLSVCGQRLDEFLFRGFLPANREGRAKAMASLRGETRPVILMDTPYRLSRLLEELARMDPRREVTLGMDLSTDQETVLTGSAESVARTAGADKKAEFMLLLHGRSLARKNSR